MIENKDVKQDENIFSILMSFIMPYWPLFAGLFILALIGAKIYLKFQPNIYQASATLLIKDKNKGVDDSRVMESINPFESKKIVENEIEIIQSHGIMDSVTKNLGLYAQYSIEGLFSKKDGYLYTPILVELRNPSNIILDDDVEQNYSVTYDEIKNLVTVNDQTYPTYEWVNGVSGIEMKFVLNPNKLLDTEKDISFSFVNAKLISNHLLQNLNVTASTKHSTVLSLNYLDPIPKRAENILNEIVNSYNKKAFDENNSLALNTLDFIQKRMDEVEKELLTLEKEIQNYKKSESAVDLSEQGKLFLKDVGDYDKEISDIKRQLSILSRIEGYIRSNNNSGLAPSSLGLNDPILGNLVSRLYDAEIEYEKLKKTTAENNPLIQSIRNEIDKIRPSIAQNVRNQKSNLNASLGNLTSSVDKSSVALNSIPEKERILLEISRRKQIKNDLFSFLQQKREEAALIYAPNSGGSRVVDLAYTSPYPVSPKNGLAYIIGIVFAMTLALGYIILKEVLNSNILFRSDIEKYSNVQIIAEIPSMKTTDKTLLQEIITVFIEPITLLIDFFKTKILRQNITDDRIDVNKLMENNESLHYFNRLSSNLGLYDVKSKNKVILVTSSRSGEGKSFISINEALNLANAGKKVALVDLDFLKPKITKSFGFSESQGAIDFLRGDKADLKLETPFQNLSVLPCGQRSRNFNSNSYTVLLLNGNLKKMIDLLSNSYDYVIIDSAPINMVADVKLLNEFADRTLFVIRHGKTPKSAIKHFDNSDVFDSLDKLSFVFNGINDRGVLNEDYGFGYGYSITKEKYY